MDQSPEYVAYSADHHSYLLRLWRGGEDGCWRASLQSVQTGERHMFADLESLLGFLSAHPWPPARHNNVDRINQD